MREAVNQVCHADRKAKCRKVYTDESFDWAKNRDYIE